MRRRPLLLQWRKAQGRVSRHSPTANGRLPRKLPRVRMTLLRAGTLSHPTRCGHSQTPWGSKVRRSRCLHLQTCRHTPDENGKRLPQRPVTPTPACAQGQRGHQTPSDTKRQEIQTSTCISSSQRFIYKNGQEESGCPPSLPGGGGGVCSAPCSAFLFQQFLQSQSPPFGMVLVHSKPGAGEREGPGRRARTAFPERALVVPHAPATPAPDPTPGAAGHASRGLLRGRKGMRSPRHAAGSGPPGGR